MQLDSADLVVVGGGIVGVSTAQALRNRGFDVVLLEQRFLAFGASGRNPGAIWAQMARTGPELDLVRASLEIYGREADGRGNTFDLQRNGGVFFFETEEQSEVLQAYVDNRQRSGIDARMVSAEELHELIEFAPPYALGGVFCPEDAQINSARFVRALSDAGKRSGIRYYENTPVLGLLRHGESITGVRTVRGNVEASGVVWCAGPWATMLEAEGIPVPVRSIRFGQMQVQPGVPRTGVIAHGPRGVVGRSALTELDAFDPALFASPFLSERNGLEYEDVMVQDDAGYLQVGYTVDLADSLNPHITMAASKLMLDTMTDRRPEYDRLGVTGLWAGLVAETADELPIIDKIDGLFVNTGHRVGLGTGPASGELLAQLVVGDTPSIPLELFSATRPALTQP